MSTDLGFKCRECAEARIVDRGFPEVLRKALVLLPILQQVRRAGFAVALEDAPSGRESLSAALDFAADHQERGHTIVLVDEYGYEESEW